MNRLLLVGLDEPEVQELRPRLDVPMVAHDLAPCVKVENGRLLVEHPDDWDRFLPVKAVVFHGIFEDDFPLITALALWGGPCLPRARGMMDCRQRIPCLVRALGVTQFGDLARGWLGPDSATDSTTPLVAKWGEWHCGENKQLFTGEFRTAEPTLLEPFLDGEAVRVQAIGDQTWQIHLDGDDWKKSLHHERAGFMPPDPELIDDARRLQAFFGLEVIGVDYVITPDGRKYLLEVNHIPNVTQFAPIRASYLDFVEKWVRDVM